MLSPASKKKTGRAYVALARAQSEKYVIANIYAFKRSDCVQRGDLQVALDLYRKAESYVPDNTKLKERWILFVVHVFLCKLSPRKQSF